MYIFPTRHKSNFSALLKRSLHRIESIAGLSFESVQDGYKITIPTNAKHAHEDHFSAALQQFLSYCRNGAIPNMERSFMLAKYFLTTEALEKASVSVHRSEVID